MHKNNKKNIILGICVRYTFKRFDMRLIISLLMSLLFFFGVLVLGKTWAYAK